MPISIDGQMEKLLKRARELGLKLLVENVFERDLRFPTRLMERLGGDLGLCLDAGHYAVHAGRSPAEWGALRAHIEEIHLHDNDGKIDRHWPLGQGNLDFAALFAALEGKRPALTLELYGDLENAAAGVRYLNALGILTEGW